MQTPVWCWENFICILHQKIWRYQKTGSARGDEYTPKPSSCARTCQYFEKTSERWLWQPYRYLCGKICLLHLYFPSVIHHFGSGPVWRVKDSEGCMWCWFFYFVYNAYAVGYNVYVIMAREGKNSKRQQKFYVLSFPKSMINAHSHCI